MATKCLLFHNAAKELKMGLHKNTKRGKCPFNKWKPCNPECVLYRKGIRYWKTEKRDEPFEDCAINIIADGTENQVQRTFALQKEMGETKNAVLFGAIANLAESEEAKEALSRMIQNAGGLNKLIGGSNEKTPD